MSAQVALKLFPAGTELRSFAHEINILCRTQHPNVVCMLGACIKVPRMCLVEELCHGSLEQ